MKEDDSDRLWNDTIARIGGRMRCPKCNRLAKCTDSRPTFAEKARRRRYKCEYCGNRWRTYEMTVTDLGRFKNDEFEWKIV